MTKLKVAGAALNQTPFDWKANLFNIEQAINMARDQSVDVLCLPELCITGYGCEDLFLSEWLPKKAVSYMLKIPEMCKGIVVTVGFPMRVNNTLYNCTAIIDDGKIKGISPKQNLANDGVHYEKRWFEPWKSSELISVELEGEDYPFGDIMYDLYGVKTGIEICEDAWVEHEKRPACRLFEQGVQMILNPSASHFAFAKSYFRENLVIDSSRQYDCVYVYANLLGNEAGRMIYDGEVFITQKGRLIQRNERLSFEEVNLSAAIIDFVEPDESHTLDPKDDEQDKNTEFAKATSLALFDYLRKSKSKGFVLSLSGGADSSTCAIMVAEMVRRGLEELGSKAFLSRIGYSEKLDAVNKANNPEKLIMSYILTCAYQGTKNSSKDTFNSAKNLAESIGATFYTWNIDEEVASYTNKVEIALGRKLTWEQDDIALQNIQARARSPIIWMFANIKNALLLTTSNRSEGDVGYATMDGDTSGSIAPIAAVDKHFIQQWLQWTQSELGYVGLNDVNSLEPSAELRPLESTQTDEIDLMPYKIMVEIERLAIRDRHSPVEVFQKLLKMNLEQSDLLKQHIIKFFRLWARNQWKRERIAPAFHLDEFNVDPRTWCRFPILSSGYVEELDELINIA